MACETIFKQRLRERGLRLTHQRKLILEALHQGKGYMSAEEIYERIRHADATVDRSTVYRTLDLLRHLGLVVAVDTGDGQARYELLGARTPHLHLVCERCGQVLTAPMEAADSFIEALLAQRGFAADLSDVTIPGLCAACRQEQADG